MTIQEFVDGLVERDLVKERNAYNDIETTRNCQRIYEEHGLPPWEDFGKLTNDYFRVWCPPKNMERAEHSLEWEYVDFDDVNPDMQLSELYGKPDWRRVYNLMVFFGAEDIFDESRDEYVDLDNIVF